jgi:hypothetical protein
LAHWHQIADDKRTAFQARLKNFHKLNYPPDRSSSKGKPSLYDEGLALQMALALEVTQLGIPPDLAVKMLTENDVVVRMAARQAANEWLAAHEERAAEGRSIYLYFDPSPLASLRKESELQGHLDPTESFFYGAIADVQNLLQSKRRGYERMALVNLTKVVIYTGIILLPASESGISEEFVNFIRAVSSWGEGGEVTRPAALAIRRKLARKAGVTEDEFMEAVRKLADEDAEEASYVDPEA